MRRRPQPNPLRGILRALGVAVVLIVVLLAAFLVASSLTAPSVHAPAPTPPPTPAPRPSATPAKAKTTKPVPTPTKKKGALGTTGNPRSAVALLANRASTKLVDRVLGRSSGRHRDVASSAGVAPIAYFRPTGGAYSLSPLFVASSPFGRSRRVAYGDALVPPVRSADGRFVAFVRVSQTSSFPGAHWSLMSLDLRSGHQEVAAQWDALGLTPLGWSGGRLIYLVANSTDTTIYAVGRGQPIYLGIMMAQPLISASLSPDGRHVAFAAPTSCAYCTVNVYELDEGSVWTGPTGMPNESTLVWTSDGSALVAMVGNYLQVLSEDSHESRDFLIPRGLPSRWDHPMRATVSGDTLQLLDMVTGKSYQSHQR